MLLYYSTILLFYTHVGKPSADKEVKKWDAWNNKKGMDDKRAKELYVEKYKVLASKCA